MTLHFLMRVPLLTPIDGRSINTIDAHAKVLEASGEVSVAKFGASNRVEPLQEQLKSGTRTNLIIVYRQNNGFHALQSRIRAIRRGSATNDIRKSSPEYHASLSYAAGLWFIIESPLIKCDLSKLRLASNKKPVLEVLAVARTPAMLVEAL
jgi:hypothetical protein